MMNLKVCSLNARGKGDQLKRRETFNWLREKKISIYLLQEIHSIENTAPVWSAEWGLTSLFTSYSSSRGGVAILFNNNFTFQLQRSFLDNTGRFIICVIKTNEKLITLATIYAPNEDDSSFLKDFTIT